MGANTAQRLPSELLECARRRSIDGQWIAASGSRTLAARCSIVMVSFTGSARAGVRIAEFAARSGKRVHHSNYAPPDYAAPFGGYEPSGNGREYGEWGLEGFPELKSIVGAGPEERVV